MTLFFQVYFTHFYMEQKTEFVIADTEDAWSSSKREVGFHRLVKLLLLKKEIINYSMVKVNKSR